MSEFLKIITKPFSSHQYFLLIPLKRYFQGFKKRDHWEETEPATRGVLLKKVLQKIF